MDKHLKEYIQMENNQIKRIKTTVVLWDIQNKNVLYSHLGKNVKV